MFTETRLEFGNILLDEDSRLMVKAAQGDGTAYSKLCEKYSPIITRYAARRNGHNGSSEDIAQEVLTRIYKDKADYQPTAAFKTYLFTYVKNILSENKLSSVNKGITLDTDELSHLTAKPSQFETTSQNSDVVAYLEKAIAKLPDRQRKAFELIYITGLSPANTAETLNCSINAVYVALHRAKKALRRILKSSCPDIL